MEAHDLVTQDLAPASTAGPGRSSLGLPYLDGVGAAGPVDAAGQSLAQRADEAVVGDLAGHGDGAAPRFCCRYRGPSRRAPSWHACALGDAIVADLPGAAGTRALAADLALLTGKTKTTWPASTRARTGPAQRGYAIEDQETTVGDVGLAAPSSPAKASWPAPSASSAPRACCVLQPRRTRPPATEAAPAPSLGTWARGRRPTLLRRAHPTVRPGTVSGMARAAS